jgi:colicin import membrane protein
MSETIMSEDVHPHDGAEVASATTPSTALAIVKTSTSTVLAADTANILGKLADEIAGFEPDVSTEKGRKKIASIAYKVSTTKTALVDLANNLMDADKKRIAKILAERKIIETNLDALRDEMRAPLNAFEAAEKARVQEFEAALAEISAMGDDLEGLSAEQINARIWLVPDLESRQWAEFVQRAERIISATLQALNDAHEAAVAREKAEAEAEAARRIEAAHIAEENARRQEQREREIAENARAQAILEADAKAERARVAAAQALADSERERQRLADEAERARIKAHKDALAALDGATSVLPGESAENIRSRLDWLLSLPDRSWEEFAAVAADYFARGEANLRAGIAAADKREAEAEERARQQADAKARADAEAAVALERQRVAEAAEAQRAKDERRQADAAHRAKIIGEAAADIMAAFEPHFTGSDIEAGLVINAVLQAILDGRIAHVRIEF